MPSCCWLAICRVQTRSIPVLVSSPWTPTWLQQWLHVWRARRHRVLVLSIQIRKEHRPFCPLVKVSCSPLRRIFFEAHLSYLRKGSKCYNWAGVATGLNEIGGKWAFRPNRRGAASPRPDSCPHQPAQVSVLPCQAPLASLAGLHQGRPGSGSASYHEKPPPTPGKEAVPGTMECYSTRFPMLPLCEAVVRGENASGGSASSRHHIETSPNPVQRRDPNSGGHIALPAFGKLGAKLVNAGTFSCPSC
jgi:hypothetical protein